MANTPKQPYCLADYEKLPNWLKRSWNVFERINIRADYQNDLAATRERVAAGAAASDEVIRIVRDYKLGQGMDALVKHQLLDPLVDNETLLNLLMPPLRFIDYGVGKVLPSHSPSEEFANNERLRQTLIAKSGIDIGRAAETTYLLIPPGTTRTELIEFVESHYEAATKEFGVAPDLYFESARTTKQRIKRVSDDEILDERILELTAAGKRIKDITVIVNDEFGRNLISHEVSSRLYQLKRRKGRH